MTAANENTAQPDEAFEVNIIQHTCDLDYWLVEAIAIGRKQDGWIERAEFSGPNSEARAKTYALWAYPKDYHP